MLVTAVRLALLLTGCAARHLLQDGPKLVGTAEELEAAIRDAETDILFTQNVTLSQSNFPEVPRICLADAPTISSVRDCSEEAVVYSNTQPSASGNMTWSSVPSAFLDARYMQRAIVLGSQLVLRDMQIAQMTDDRSPRFVLFELIESGSLIIQNSVLYSPCGGRGPQHYITSLLTIFPVSSAYEISTERNEVLFFDSQAYKPTPTTFIRLFNTTVRCYNPLESPFAPEVVPEDWLPTSDVTTLRPSDECQRRETLGTDYRGMIARTVNGYRCQYWNTTYPQDHTFGPARLPAWGLGSQETSHNFCRNPDSHQDGVWCYIEDDAAPDQFQRRQPCDVPWCEGGVVADLTLGSRTEVSEPEAKQNDISTGVLIGIIAAAMVLIILFGLLVRHAYQREPCGWCISFRDDPAVKRKGSRDSGVRAPVGEMAGGADKGSTGKQNTRVTGTLAYLIRQRLNQRRQDDALGSRESNGRSPHSQGQALTEPPPPMQPCSPIHPAGGTLPSSAAAPSSHGGLRPLLPSKPPPTNSQREGTQVTHAGSESTLLIASTVPVSSMRTFVADGREKLEDALDATRRADALLCGRYEVLAATDRRVGGQGCVQFVFDRQTRVECAVKFFFARRHFDHERDLYADATLRSAMAATREVCANDDGAVKAMNGAILPPFIVLERGESLDEFQRLQNTASGAQHAGRIDIVTVAQAMLHTAACLASLHRLGWVHRDLKPANVLRVPRSHTWTLIDFGSAARIGQEAPIEFTAAYAAPEVARAYLARQATVVASPAMDVWALGLIAYELLTGERPFRLGAPKEEIFAVLTGQGRLPWEGADVDSAAARRVAKLGMFRRGVLQCLERDPEERPALASILASWQHVFTATTTATLGTSSAKTVT